ncbi:MAG TPA: TIGR00730 family Rossman fold protein [Burkholderiaceae bacterium]|nr:TIGR00730 family Rossman fold protein [Burkholderiaceae bacterium]
MSAAAPASDRPPAVCVFCGARPGGDPRFLGLARRAGALLAASGATVVYGGGSVGMMGALADAALAEGGEVVGVIPALLMAREVGHRGLTRLEVVPDMQVRKQRMIELSDAFLTLPGGLGTLDELFEVLTLRQLGVHDRPIVAVSDRGYFDALAGALRAFVADGLAAERDVAALELVPTLEDALPRLGLGRT